MKKIVIVLTSLLLLLAAGVGGTIFWRMTIAPARAEPPKPIRDFSTLEERLRTAAAASEKAAIHVLGEVSDKGSTWPVLMFSHEPEGRTEYRILLIGGIHGNEPAGTVFLMQFAEALAQGMGTAPGVAFDIIPVVNPWGWVHGRRRTGQGRDLNREFNSFKAPEAVLLRDLCKRIPYDLMVDFHEDGQVEGFYFYRLAHPNTALCRAVIEGVRDAGLPIHHGRVSKIFHAEDGVINCALWSLRLARVTRQLSVSNYYRLEGCPQSFLFETPRRLPLEVRVDMNRVALDTLMKQWL